MWVGIIPYAEGLKRTKRQRKVDFALCLNAWAGTEIFLLFRPSHLDWNPLYWVSVLQAFEVQYNFLGFPACRQQILGSLSLYNRMSQYLIVNLFVGVNVHNIYFLLVLFPLRTLVNRPCLPLAFQLYCRSLPLDHQNLFHCGGDLVTKSCPTLCDPMDYSLPGSSIHGILQARILEWVAISFSRGYSQPRNWTRVSCIAGRFFTNWAMRDQSPQEGQVSLVIPHFPDSSPCAQVSPNQRGLSHQDNLSCKTTSLQPSTFSSIFIHGTYNYWTYCYYLWSYPLKYKLHKGPRMDAVCPVFRTVLGI